MTQPKLTKGQAVILGTAVVPMLAAGGLGGWGTYANVLVEFGRGATAIGVVAAGEGVTLVLALVMVGLTMLGQSAPLAVRTGMWAAPLAAAGIGLVVADNATEAVVYGLTPMAMCASAEGMGLLARRIVVYRTGVDMEAQRRNAETVQLLAYHRARAVNHPSEWTRNRSARAAWRLARRVGVGDNQLGAALVDVQRERLTEGADAALGGMYGATQTPALPAPKEEQEERPLGELLNEIGWCTPGSYTAARPTAEPSPQAFNQVMDEVWAGQPANAKPVTARTKPTAKRTTVPKTTRRPRTVSAKVNPAPAADEAALADRARRDFTNGVPGVKALKAYYGIGQAKAQRVRDAIQEADGE